PPDGRDQSTRRRARGCPRRGARRSDDAGAAGGGGAERGVSRRGLQPGPQPGPRGGGGDRGPPAHARGPAPGRGPPLRVGGRRYARAPRRAHDHVGPIAEPRRVYGGSTGVDTPMMQQYRALKQRYPDHLLLFRLGDFYELFLEDAELGARLLSITLTS